MDKFISALIPFRHCLKGVDDRDGLLPWRPEALEGNISRQPFNLTCSSRFSVLIKFPLVSAVHQLLFRSLLLLTRSMMWLTLFFLFVWFVFLLIRNLGSNYLLTIRKPTTYNTRAVYIEFSCMSTSSVENLVEKRVNLPLCFEHEVNTSLRN